MRPIFRLTAALTALGLIYAYLHYEREKREYVARLRAGSQILHTLLGPIEYAFAGKGQPVLLMHGAGNGYAQGLLFTHLLDPENFQTIAVSRPGYLRTPLSSGKTPEAQANLGAALLDELHIEKTAVLGISAGGLSAIQFALRHPNCCQGLIPISAAAPAIKTTNAGEGVLGLFRLTLASDFFMWLVYKLSSPFLIRMLSGDAYDEMLQSPEKKAIADWIMNAFLAISLWREGVLNDIAQVARLSAESLKQITLPTLVIHGTHDSFVPYAVGQHTASTIPNAQLISIHGGQHFSVATHKDQVAAAMNQLISRNT